MPVTIVRKTTDKDRPRGDPTVSPPGGVQFVGTSGKRGNEQSGAVLMVGGVNRRSIENHQPGMQGKWPNDVQYGKNSLDASRVDH